MKIINMTLFSLDFVVVAIQVPIMIQTAATVAPPTVGPAHDHNLNPT